MPAEQSIPMSEPEGGTSSEDEERRWHRSHPVEVIVLIAVPLILGVCAFFRIEAAALLTVMTAVASLVVFFFCFERSRPGLRQVVPTAVLGALAAAGRILFAPLPNIMPVTAICIISGVVYGRRCGFMVGALAALISNFFFGQGLWTPWQMYAWGLIGYLAGVLADHGVFEHRVLLYVFGVVAAFAYGFILNSWYLIGYVDPISIQTAALAYGGGIIIDINHAVATLVFLLLLYAPWRRKLERVRIKYALGEV